VEKDGDISLFSLQIDDGDGDGEWSRWLADSGVVVAWWWIDFALLEMEKRNRVLFFREEKSRSFF